MGQITIKDLLVFFDDADEALVLSHKWHLHPSGKTIYARGYPCGTKRKLAKLVYMHRLITGAALPDDVDHTNGNGLDNRRSNLRICSRTMNNANRHATVSETGVKGVHFEKWSGRWRAEVMCHGKRYKLGRFGTQEEAAAAYERKARELFGEFARATHL